MDLAGVVLAAGFGTRLRPLTDLWPKALCTVGGVPLLDVALERLRPLTSSIAVNAHHLSDLVVDHLRSQARDVHVSVERPGPLGTAGALGALRGWIAGRAVLATNADAWLRPNDLRPLVDEWDGRTLRLLVVEEPARPDFGGRWRFAGASLIPEKAVTALDSRPSSLYDEVWEPAFRRGKAELVVHEGEFVDCGTPADYLRANRLASIRS